MRLRPAFAIAAATALTVACKDSNKPEPPGPPANVSVSSGSEQHGAAGTALLAPVAVKVTDAKGRGVSGAAVQFVVLAGGGSVDPVQATTNGSGVAITTWVMGTHVGATSQLLAKLVDPTSGALLDTALVSATIDAGPVASVQPGYYPSYSATGAAIVPALSVRLLDQYGNPVSGATVSWIRTLGDGSIAPATSTSNAQGVATATATLGTTAGNNVFAASIGAQTATFTIEGRLMTVHVASLSGGGFGIARTSDGKLVTANISSGTVDVFNAGATSPTRTIAVGGTPTVAAVDPAGTTAYIANMNGYMSIVNISTGTFTNTTIPDAHALALSPSGNRVWVARTTGWVDEVSTSSGAVLDSVPVPYGPWGIAFSTNGGDTLMYVSARDGGSITEVETRNDSVTRTFTVSGRPHGLAITPDGTTLLAADNSGGAVHFISTSTGNETGAVTLAGSFGIAISPNGATAFVTTDGGTIGVVDVATKTLTKAPATGGQARQIVADPSNDKAYAANGSGWIDLVRK